MGKKNSKPASNTKKTDNLQSSNGHCKAIATGDLEAALIKASYTDPDAKEEGTVMKKGSATEKAFISAIAQHRFREREKARKMQA